jgi:hypothetical protein
VKRTIPLIVSFIVGMMMVGEFFIPHYQYRAVTNEFLEWGLILSAGAFLLGLVNLVQVNLPKVKRKEEDWQYKGIMLVALVVTLIIGFSGGTARQDAGYSYKWFFDYVFVPLNATMFALLAFYIASAAFRAFRARNLEATVLLTAAILVMIARVPIGESIPIIGDYLPRLMNWIMDIPNTAARRAIFIGAALGAIATGLRVILGMERSHLGGGDS